MAWFCGRSGKRIMVVPFIALLAILAFVVFFLVKAGKKEKRGEDLGEPGKHMSR
jgi:hypothetical protein